MELFFGYAHGTHVAGIALDGNPAARLMTLARLFDLERPRATWRAEVVRRQTSGGGVAALKEPATEPPREPARQGTRDP